MITSPFSLKNKPKVSFYTFGCRLNQSETAVVEQSFHAKDYHVVPFEEPADIVIINTCTVTEQGDLDTLRLVRKISRMNPDVKIALIGCQAQMQKEKLKALPNVCWIVGNAKKMEIAQIVEEYSTDQTAVITPPIKKEPFTIPFLATDDLHTRVNVKIQDGCDFFCSFCEIPYARGRARSREFSDIISEATRLAQKGYKEIVLTGINIGTYQDNSSTFMDVIESIEQIEGIKRIRISSIEPTTIPKELIQKMARSKKLCRHLHIPLQSADDEILSSMKRKYNFQEFADFIHFAHDHVKDICIGTDVIVGFPGETEKHFDRTYNRLLDLPLHYIHTFSYSARSMAKSQHFGDATQPPVIQKRSALLRDLSQRKKRIFYEQFAGTTQEVLFEEKKKGEWSGLTDNYLRINVLSQRNLRNEFHRVQIKNINSLNVCGALIS